MKNYNLIVKTSLISFLIAAVCIFIYAFLGETMNSEPYTGNFEINELSSGWRLTGSDGTVLENVTLPYSSPNRRAGTVTLSNTLPGTVHSGMCLSFRSIRQNVEIYINGELRAEYKAENFTPKQMIPISAFVMTDLSDSDASGTIDIAVTSMDNGTEKYSSVTYAYGNNVWFPYITGNVILVSVAAASILVGLICIIGFAVIRKKVQFSKSVLYLAETIIVIGFWILSESEIRQLFLKTPSLSSIFAFIFIEIAAAFGAMYFNEVQGHRYDRLYVVLQSLVLIQVTVNTVLNFTGVICYYETLFISHILTGATLVCSFGSIINDIRSGEIRKYSMTALGMLLMICLCTLELVNFYIGSPLGLGVFLSIGLLVLLAATIMQAVADAIKRSEEKRLYSEKMTKMTFRTIASTIDAKDEYTGGHSERVGNYAALICSRIKEKEQLTAADIDRIQYIGKMHDIGKIGVPDKVLNKNGRLTDEEYELMKKHTVIGSDIIGNIDNVEGLNDGVRHHHERYDGKGYPDGLKGKGISLFARVLCLADCYDAMTTDRVYRKRLPKEKVIEEIERNRGTQFDPGLADIVLQMIRSGELEG